MFKKKSEIVPSGIATVLLGRGEIGIYISPLYKRLLSFVMDIILFSPVLLFSFVFYYRMIFFNLEISTKLAWFDMSFTLFAASPLSFLGLVVTVSTSFSIMRYIFSVMMGRTPGMALMKIHYTDKSLSSEIPWQRVFVRELFTIISISFIGAGYLWAVLDDANRGWHDKISGLYMVNDEKFAP